MNDALFTYEAFGLGISSDIPLPELFVSDQDPHIVIRRGAVPASLPKAVSRGVCYEANPEYVLYRVPGIANFLVDQGRDVTYETLGDERDVRAILLGPVMGALLHQRGLLPLHAAVVETGDTCIAFAGTSGVGKSMLAAGLYKRGFPILSDNICAIQLGGSGVPAVLPAYPELLLWQDTLACLGYDSRGLVRRRAGLGKFRFPVKERYTNEKRRLAAVFFLNCPILEYQTEFLLVKGSQRIQSLAFHVYGKGVLDGIRSFRESFRAFVHIAEQVPFFEVAIDNKASIRADQSCIAVLDSFTATIQKLHIVP